MCKEFETPFKIPKRKEGLTPMEAAVTVNTLLTQQGRSLLSLCYDLSMKGLSYRLLC